MRSVLLSLVLLSTPAMAFEGHWRPAQVPDLSAEVAELGSELTAAQLADLESAPLGAIVDLDYCSAAFVSPDGLIATAYHCVTDQLQFASGDGEDLFEDGFYAPTREEERWAGPREHIRITTSIEDVTDQVLSGTKKLEGGERLEKIQSNMKTLVKRCESSADLRCEVATYGDGSDYELITQLDIRDVRLVYAPPRAVGYFGGDDDNWRWPRHSGDFAFIRAYVGENGRPADHHPANVAYQPEHHLPVAKAGPKPGEFVMVAGYPGGTYRWLSAAELDYAAEERYPLVVGIRRDLLAMFADYSERYPELGPVLAPRRLNLSNDEVYITGTLEQFERAGTAAEKWEFERDLSRWIAADAERAAEFGDVLDTIHRLQAEEAATSERDYVLRQMVSQTSMLHAATTIYKLSIEAAKPDKDRDSGFQNRDRPALAAELDQLDTGFDWRVDRGILHYFLVRAAELPSGLHVAELDLWLDYDPETDDLEKAISARLDVLYDNVDLADADARRDLMGTSAWYLTHSDNPWFTLAEALHPFLERIDDESDEREAEWREVKPRYLSAVRGFVPEARPRFVASTEEFAPGVFYPDANSTLRITLGKVDGYFPRDGLIATPRSTVDGVTGKAGDAPYDAPDELLTAIGSHEFGPYQDDDLHSVPANFLSTLDTARGSSGSATMNAKGEFIGVLFDGTYEAIASDWIFDQDMTRSIHTDISYILWYLDRVADAAPLLEELGIDPTYASTGGVGEATEPEPAGDEGGTE